MSLWNNTTFDVRFRAVRAVLEEQLPVTVVAQAYGTNRSTVHRWLARFHEGGDIALERRPVSGRPRKVESLDAAGLIQVLMAPASQYGYETDFWTTRRLIQVIESQFGVRVSKQTVTGKRGGVAAMSAITSRGRLIFRLHEKRIASPEVIDFLAQMLEHHRRRHLVVVMDQAPPHVSKATLAFIESQCRLHVFHLPKYSPDWNPDEKVWNHLKHQELKGHQAKTKDELSQLTHQKLTSMSHDPELLRGIFFRCCAAELLNFN